MSALREAAQQAAEALYRAREFTELYDTEHAASVNEQCHDTITALRAALAQQEEPVQEPVATLIAQRDALLEVVRYIGEYRGEGPCTTPWRNIVADLGEKARAAIKAVEETK